MSKPFTARPYQSIMLDHIVPRERSALWVPPGFGKTPVGLMYLDGKFLAGEDHPALVLGPKRVVRGVWPKESQKWDHLRHISVVSVTGSDAEKRLSLKQDASVIACNYENIPWLVDYWGDRWPYRIVIADESTRLKNLRLSFQTSSKGKQFVRGQGGKRSRALGSLAHTKIKQFIELSGTPAPNGLVDLWGQMWFLDGGVRLGRSFTAFKQRWFRPSPDGYGSIPLHGAEAEIHDKVRDLCLSLKVEDWFDIQLPIMSTIEVDLPPRARQLYDDMEKDMFAQIEEHGVEAFNAAARTQKCLQLANGACYIDDKQNWKDVHEEKLLALDSLVEESSGMPMLVGYEFKSDRARILQYFGERAVDISTDAGMTKFMKGRTAIGLAHPKSMGHGVDGLQDITNILALFGHNWDLELYQQLIERIGPVRQEQSGHKRPVYVYHIIARNTVDELVMARRETKREVQDLLLDAVKRRK